MSIRVDVVSDDAVEVVADEITEFVDHFSSQLSVEGVFLESAVQPQRGRELVVTLRLEDGLVLVKTLAMVAWQRHPRPDSVIKSGFALHFLRVDEGRKFLERIASEQESRGGLVFSVDRSEPVTHDGRPPQESELDRMMAQRGARSGTAELRDLGPTEDATPKDNSPEFAPGFGRAELWNSDVSMPIPGQVGALLEGDQRAERSEKAGSEKVGSEKVGPETVRREKAGPDKAGQTELGNDRESPAQAGSGESKAAPKERSGPIRMKLKADRQPATPTAPAAASSSSFVEASRQVSELMAAGSASTTKPGAAGGTEDVALATVAIKPGDLEQYLESGKGAASEQQGVSEEQRGSGEQRSAGEAEPVRESGVGSNADPGQPSPDTLGPAPNTREDLPNEYQPQLQVDSDVLGGELHSGGLGYTDEDRLPMVVVGVIVGSILLALILWAVL